MGERAANHTPHMEVWSQSTNPFIDVDAPLIAWMNLGDDNARLSSLSQCPGLVIILGTRVRILLVFMIFMTYNQLIREQFKVLREGAFIDHFLKTSTTRI